VSKKKKTKKVVDELLAAPDSTKKSRAEKLKYHQRKAREEALKEQNRRGKLRRKPSIEDMLVDIVRVADDKATNPFAKFRTISRKRYILYGHFPIEAIDEQFGQFEHALQVAGLRDQPGTRMWRANRAKASRAEHTERYLERYVAPYVINPKSLKFNDDGSYLMLSISDTHSQFLDPFVWFAYLSALRDLRPDCALLNGDTLEAVEISRHPKIPGWTEPLQSELDFKREMFRQIREDAKFKGDLIDTGGNHDTGDRLAHYLTQVAPALAGLRCLRVDELLGLDEFNVQLAHGGTILSPSGQEDQKPGLLLFDFYRVHHGHRLGINPAHQELKDAGRSGQSGHTHRADMAFGTTERDEGMSWMVTPMGARHELGRSYIKSPTCTGWQRGLGVARLFPDGTVHQYPAIVLRGKDGRERITIEGITYFRPDDMKDPPTTGQWLAEQKLKD
jgi:hypothetical protein